MKSQKTPQRYSFPMENGGRITEFFYEYEGERKRALVYLPRAVDLEPDERFPVFTLCHGGGGSENDFLGGIEGKTTLKSVFDHLIAEEILAPTIVVTPTYARRNSEDARFQLDAAQSLTERFWKEWKNALIPAVDAAFPTIADRDGRAFGGFSMGAEATWSALAWGGDAARYYLPMSGDFWVVSIKGGADHTSETCDRLIAAMEQNGLKPGDCEVFAATGTNDIAYSAMRPMVEELFTRAPWFGDVEKGGNLCWCVSDGAHSYEWCVDYMAQGLPRFFPGKGFHGEAIV